MKRQRRALYRQNRTLIQLALLLALVIVFNACLHSMLLPVAETIQQGSIQPLSMVQSNPDIEDQMSTVCHQSYMVTSGLMEDQCGKLIDQVQADGQHEVLNNSQGYFWTEVK